MIDEEVSYISGLRISEDPQLREIAVSALCLRFDQFYKKLERTLQRALRAKGASPRKTTNYPIYFLEAAKLCQLASNDAHSYLQDLLSDTLRFRKEVYKPPAETVIDRAKEVRKVWSSIKHGLAKFCDQLSL